MTCRPKNSGLVLLRRSGNRQETSFEKQLTWAIGRACVLNVQIDAAVEDLEHIRQHRLSSYKSIRLDDAIPGDELDRAGLVSLMSDAIADKRISHVFAFARDRLGRPQSPVDMMQREVALVNAGITLVLGEETISPSASGQMDITELLKMMLGYHISGEHPRKLAEQMIATQRVLAERGHSVGGTPTYGFVRALVDADNKVIRYLDRGEHIRKAGCHVMWLPDPNDDSKIKLRIEILLMKENGSGYKRIAEILNRRGIPSPAAGMTRTDHGRKHVIEGLWNHTTVKHLCEDRKVLAIFDYGRRSEGKHRRLGSNGHRYLDDHDRNTQGKPKVIWNPPELIMSRRLPFDPKFDPDRWNKIQEETRRRSHNQRGVARANDPAKYPLACRVYDLTAGCGSLMYGRTSGKRRVFTCGRYMKSGGAVCDHNQVDAESLLKFTMAFLAEMVDRMGDREQLRLSLLDLARQQHSSSAPDVSATQKSLEGKIKDLERQLQVAAKNYTLTENPDLRADAERIYGQVNADLARAKSEIQNLAQRQVAAKSVDDEVESAMRLLDRLREMTGNPALRAGIPGLLKDLGLFIGLNFADGIKGQKRHVRLLTGGVITFGDPPLPPKIKCLPGGKALDSGSIHASPVSATEPTKRHPEGISFTKVNRGDRI